MKKTTYTVTRFDIENCMNDGFYVEVTPNEKDKTYDFVLCKERYGLKSFMFGIMMKDITEDDFEDFVERNVCDYIHDFIEDIERWESCE